MDRIIEKKRWSLKKVALYGIGGLVMIALVYGFWSSASSSRLNVEKDRLSIGTVKRGPFREFIPITGNVLPIKTVYLDAIEGGRVEKIFAEDGDVLKEGDSILQLSNTTLQMDFINREAQILDQINNLRNTRISLVEQGLRLKEQLLETRFQLKEQQKKLEVQTALIKEDVIPKNEFETTQNEHDYLVNKLALIKEKIKADSLLRTQQLGQLDFSLELMHRNLAIIHKNMDNLVVRSPITGQLSSLRVELGESINKGENLGQIDVLDSYKVRANIDEHYVSRIMVEQHGQFQFAGQDYTLTVKKIFPEVANGTFEVDMLFDGELAEGIKRGQSLQIKLALSDEAPALLIPRGGFYRSTGGNWIFVVNHNDNMAYKREIRIGRQNPSHYEVMEGLEEGEQVVTSSYDAYRDIDELVLK